mmetsp:Transcript_48840/g.116114  ORF Transcript_48840/g.116114 Transcript_48840/m.116114 type:complete len:229 (-) Transcript_48840:8-694(-)
MVSSSCSACARLLANAMSKVSTSCFHDSASVKLRASAAAAKADACSMRRRVAETPSAPEVGKGGGGSAVPSSSARAIDCAQASQRVQRYSCASTASAFFFARLAGDTPRRDAPGEPQAGKLARRAAVAQRASAASTVRGSSATSGDHSLRADRCDNFAERAERPAASEGSPAVARTAAASPAGPLYSAAYSDTPSLPTTSAAAALGCGTMNAQEPSSLLEIQRLFDFE